MFSDFLSRCFLSFKVYELYVIVLLLLYVYSVPSRGFYRMMIPYHWQMATVHPITRTNFSRANQNTHKHVNNLRNNRTVLSVVNCSLFPSRSFILVNCERLGSFWRSFRKLIKMLKLYPFVLQQWQCLKRSLIPEIIVSMFHKC